LGKEWRFEKMCTSAYFSVVHVRLSRNKRRTSLCRSWSLARSL